MEIIHSPLVKIYNPLNLASKTLTILALVSSIQSCAYRLTNRHLKNPNKIETVSIESVYDTGGEVIPHEHLWNELQRAFAANGHLKLAPINKSDALVRAHIKQAGFTKSGSVVDVNPGAGRPDPSLYQQAADPLPPTGLPNLSTARSYFDKDNLSFTVDVEVWEIATHKLLLQRSYAASSDIRASRKEANVMMHVRHEEAADHAVARLARQIAETVVSDLLVR